MKLKVYIHSVGEWYEKYMTDERLKELESFCEIVNDGPLKDPVSPDALIKRMAGCDTVLSLNGYGEEDLTEEVFRKVGTVKRIVIAHWWGQFMNIDTKALGIELIEGSKANTVAVAEWVIGCALNGIRRIPDIHKDIRENVLWYDVIPMQSLLYKRTVGLIGMGRIGKEVSKLFNAFGCKVTAYDKYISDEELSALNVKRVGLDEAFSQSDIISLHLPVTPETIGLMGENQFKLIKDGAVFINAALSAIYDESAFIRECQKARFSAYIDVFDTEPLPADSAFRKLDNVYLSPPYRRQQLRDV